MKRKIGSMTVKRAIISAMVAMLVVSSPMTAMASGLDNHGTSSAPVSANSAEYNNTETSGNSDAAQMLQDCRPPAGGCERFPAFPL